jgi:hypothetical protein
MEDSVAALVTPSLLVIWGERAGRFAPPATTGPVLSLEKEDLVSQSRPRSERLHFRAIYPLYRSERGLWTHLNRMGCSSRPNTFYLVCWTLRSFRNTVDRGHDRFTPDLDVRVRSISPISRRTVRGGTFPFEVSNKVGFPDRERLVRGLYM